MVKFKGLPANIKPSLKDIHAVFLNNTLGSGKGVVFKANTLKNTFYDVISKVSSYLITGNSHKRTLKRMYQTQPLVITRAVTPVTTSAAAPVSASPAQIDVGLDTKAPDYAFLIAEYRRKQARQRGGAAKS